MENRSVFFQTYGALSNDAPSYIERKADRVLIELLERGELCLVLAPRQTGKSSLMHHVIKKLEDKGVRAGFVDPQALGSELEPEQWFSDVLYQVERSLQLKTDSGDWWEVNSRLGPTQRFTKFLEDVVLKEESGNVVIFFDEIDSVLPLAFSDDFFTTIRAIYNARAAGGSNAALRRLTFVLLGVTTPSALIRNKTRTPFNIGISILLEDFERKNTKAFEEVLGPNSDPLVDRMFYWTSGQPLLIQRLSAAAYEWDPEERRPDRLDDEVRSKYLEKKVEDDRHLSFIQDYMLDETSDVPKTLNTYRKVLKGKKITEDRTSMTQNRLRLAGVISASDKMLNLRNRIYTEIFGLEWVKEHTRKDVPKMMAYGASSVMALALLWFFVIRSMVAPEFPNIPPIVIYTADPSIERQVQVSKDISHAVLISPTLSSDVVISPQNGLIEVKMASLPHGESFHTLRFVGGIFNDTKDILLKTIYYPQWMVKEFPDARLKKISVVMETNEHILKVRDVSNGSAGIFDEHQSNVTCAVFSSDKKLALSGSEDGTLVLLELTKQKGNFQKESTFKLKQIQVFMGHDGRVASAAFSPDRRTVVSGSGSGTIILWNVETGRKLHALVGHRGTVRSVAFSRDGKTILSVGQDKTIRLWDVITGQLLHTLHENVGTVLCATFLSNGNAIAWGSEDNSVRIISIDGYRPVRTMTGHTSPVTKITISQNGKWILTGSDDKTIRLWDAKTLKSKEIFRGFEDKLRIIGFSSDGQLVFGQSAKNELKIWDLNTKEELQLFTGHRSAITFVKFSRDGKTFVSGSADRTMNFWDVETVRQVHSFSKPQGLIGVAFSPGGETVMVGFDIKASFPDKPLFWIEKIPDELNSFYGLKSSAIIIALSPDGETITWPDETGRQIKLWNIKTQRISKILPIDLESEVFAPDFSADGKKVIVMENNSEILRIMNITTGEMRELQKFDTDRSMSLFSPDNHMIVSGSRNGSVEVSDVKTGKVLRNFSGTSDANESFPMRFSPDGKTLLVSNNKLGCLWDFKTGQKLRCFTTDQEPLAADFSPDGKMVVTGATDGSLRLWWAAITPQ